MIRRERALTASVTMTKHSVAARFSASVTKGKFLYSPLYFSAIRRRTPFRLAGIVFILAVLVQFLFSLIDGTVRPGPDIQIPFFRHYTILVGGGLLLPLAFSFISRYYHSLTEEISVINESRMLNRRADDRLFTPWLRFGTMVALVVLVIFVAWLDERQFVGPAAQINYVHMRAGRLTWCGYYYKWVLFPVLGGLIGLFMIDVVVFSRVMSRLCRAELFDLHLFHQDGLYGLRRIVDMARYISAFVVVMPFYFIVAGLNFHEYADVGSLLLNPLQLLAFAGCVVVPPLILTLFLWPIRRHVGGFKDELLSCLSLRLGDRTSPSASVNSVCRWRVLREAEPRELVSLFDHVRTINVSLVSFDVLRGMYEIAVIGPTPFIVWLIDKKFFHP